jgi:hypothetical protein
MRNLVAALVAIFLTQGAVAQKPFPKGVMVVESVNDDSNYPNWKAWSDPNVKGILLRVNWSDVQPPLGGAISWTYFEDVLQYNKTNNLGKWFVLSVDGAQAPQFVYFGIPAVPKWTSSTGGTCPYPWDTNLQGYWSTLISAMGKKFDGDQSVHGVTMWAGGTAIECFFARDQNDDDKLDDIAHDGSGNGWMLWEAAAKTLINDYMSAFPTTACYLACGQDYYGANEKRSMGDLASWFYNLRLGSNGLQSNAETNHYPFYDNTYRYWTFPHTALNCANYSLIMYQLLDPVGSPNMPADATVANCLSNGGPPQDAGTGPNANGNAEAIQLYRGDPAKDPPQHGVVEPDLVDFNQDQGL